MNQFGRNEPIIMKTYGKHSRRVDRWLSPDIRKAAFASTSSSDISIGEQVGQKHLRKRKKILSTASSRPVRAAKSQALAGLREPDSEEENVFNPTPEHSLGANKRRRGTLNVKALAKWKMAVRESTSESEEEKSAQSQVPSCGSGRSQGPKAGNSVAVPSYLSRFVTDRRRGVPKIPKVSQRSQVAKKHRVSVCKGSLNSSEDFVKRRAPPRRPAPPRMPAPRLVHSGNSSSELASPVPNLSRARNILKAVSLNSTADRPLGSGYKKPLLSSTPSLASRPSYRHQEPSISEISCSIDDMEEAFKTSVEATRSLVSPGQRKCKVLLERSVETAGYVRKPPSETEQVGLPLPAGKNSIGVPQHSKALFSRVDYGSEVKTRAGSVGSPSAENLSVQFVSAESRLDSLAACLGERGTPVVVLQKADLSKHLSGGRDRREEETYSSCVDSESALRSDGSENGPGPGVEAPRETENGGAGCSDNTQSGDTDPGRVREEDEGCGAGFGSAEGEESASVMCISPSILAESSGRHLGEPERGSFGSCNASRLAEEMGNRASFDEQSMDLFLESSEVEPQGGSGESLPAAASGETVSLLPQESAVNSQASGLLEAYLKKRCSLVQATVVLEALDLDRYIQGCGNLPAPGPDSAEEPQREAKISVRDPQRSPISGDFQEQPKSSSPERPRTANPEQDGAKPNEGLRRRLSSAFASKSSCDSPGLAPSPGGRKRPARARNQGGGRPKDKPGTGRKACVSGFSVSRWAKNDPHRQRPRKPHARSQLSRAGDCSLFDFQRGPDSKKQSDAGSSVFQGPSSVFPGTPSAHGAPEHLLSPGQLHPGGPDHPHLEPAEGRSLRAQEEEGFLHS
ncbi:uncharacterized protein LOC133131155 [Conger conger]|uniref:uncharacterized protein LOC133131155 n=1 Tax=Conger conger TaxID=82655 RepID=UPI002A5A3BDE|nr:uncharacterized protein LOC133131155 [Conger conger]